MKVPHPSHKPVWAIIRLKAAPPAIVGLIEAPDEASAIGHVAECRIAFRKSPRLLSRRKTAKIHAGSGSPEESHCLHSSIVIQLPQIIRREATTIAITVCPVTPSFAAEIGDVDLSKPIEPSDLSAIKDAFPKYAVLIFPEQHLSSDQHLDFARLGHSKPRSHCFARMRSCA